MERKKALIASTIVAASMMTAAVAYAASSGLSDTRRDGVGRLQPASDPAPTITVIVDPVTGAARTAPATVPASAAGSPAAASARTAHEDDDHRETTGREHDDD